MGDQLIIRIPPELKSKVDYLAKSEGKTVSGVVRELLSDYVQNRDIEGYIDDLWERIGSKMRARGYKVSDVQRVIKEVRAKK